MVLGKASLPPPRLFFRSFLPGNCTARMPRVFGICQGFYVSESACGVLRNGRSLQPAADRSIPLPHRVLVGPCIHWRKVRNSHSANGVRRCRRPTPRNQEIHPRRHPRSAICGTSGACHQRPADKKPGTSFHRSRVSAGIKLARRKMSNKDSFMIGPRRAQGNPSTCIGRGGRRFQMLKFRTSVHSAERSTPPPPWAERGSRRHRDWLSALRFAMPCSCFGGSDGDASLSARPV